MRCAKTAQLVAVLLFTFAASGQENIKSVAGLHFAVDADAGNWFEGYNAIVAGSVSPYVSHRSGVNRDSALVARTSGGDETIEWSTAAVPRAWKGTSASFLWVCGFGNNLGHEWFDLEINNTASLSFSTSDSNAWSLPGIDGTSLAFVLIAKNTNGANLGYMTLTLPGSKILPGKPLTIRLRGRSARKEVWYRMFAYRDALHYLRTAERRELFSSIELRNLGEASLTVCGKKKMAGSAVRLLSANKVIAQEPLAVDGAIATATLLIPRRLQPSNGDVTSIQVAGKNIDTIRWEQINRKRLRAFFDEELEADRYVFPAGELPAIRWKRPAEVENEMGSFPLDVEYYDREMRRVSRADSTGRYAAVVSAVLPSGFTLRRFVTLYCSPAAFDDYSEHIPVKFNELESYGISKARWRLYEQNEQYYSFGAMKMLPVRDADAAVFLAGLSELDTTRGTKDSPRLRDRQWWLTYKQSSFTKSNIFLTPPKEANGTKLLLDERAGATPPFTQESLEQIRRVCRAWADETGVPHVTLVVHKGKVVFHEAFNTGPADHTLSPDSPMWMASITKLVTGVLMMEFVDQGLVDLDAPVSAYLHELSGPSNGVLTVRQLFTHTTGLDEWSGEWASDWNPALENSISQALPYTAAGKRYSYNRIGYALAGKIMERITGRTVPYLFQDRLFTPLGMNSATADNTYGGLYCTAIDLARLGEMLLNRGTYNGYRYFSENSYLQILPAKLAGIDRSWGIGTSPMEEKGLSKEAFGHPAASGAVLRIDPANELIIISARNNVSRNQETFEKRLIEACTAPLRHD